MASSILKKIWRDLTERKGRSALTVAGLCIGFWGVGTATVAWFVLSKDLAGNFKRTNPPAIAMTVKGMSPIDVTRIGAVEGAQEIENRPQLSGRIQYAPDRWLPLVIWVVEDFTDMRVGLVFPEDATLPPGSGTIVVERDGLPVLNMLKRRYLSGTAGHGNPVIEPTAPFVRIEDGPVPAKLSGRIDIMANIGGTVFDPRQAPSRMELTIYAYATRDTVTQWGAAITDRLLVTPAPGYEDEAAIRETAERLSVRMANLGYTTTATMFPSHTEHVHQFQMNSILWLITGVGALALLMSVVLVVNLISGILTNQIRQLGVLKAIGASTNQIVLMYVTLMAVIGIIAASIALPLAVSSGFAVSSGLAALLNFELLTEALPLSAYGGFVLAASLFPVMAALPVVRHWSGVPVTDALQHCGANLEQEYSLRIERFTAPVLLEYRMGLRNAFRRPQRTLMTAATLGLGALVFITAMNTRTSLLYTAETEESTRRFDVLVSFEEPIDARRVSWMGAFPIVGRAETWRIERVSIGSSQAESKDHFRLFRVPDESDMMKPNLLAGHWLSQEPTGVVINHRLKQAFPELDPGVFVQLAVNGQVLSAKVIGIIKEFGPASLYMRDAYYRSWLDDRDQRVNAGFLRLKEPTNERLAELTALLESHFDLTNVRIRGLQSSKIASRIIRGHLDSIVATLLILALLVLTVSTLGMISAMSTNIVERGREFAILRSIGGTPATIRRILSGEAITIAIIGWAFAVALSFVVSPAVSDFFGQALVEYPFDFRFSPLGILTSLGVTVSLAIFASIIPAQLASRQPIRAAMQNGS